MSRLKARAGLAAACAFVMAAAGVQVGTDSAATAAPSAEIAVIPPDPAEMYAPDRMVMAGATGFLHMRRNDLIPEWTSYSDSVTKSLKSDIPNWSALGFLPAGGDTMWTSRPVPGHSTAGFVAVVDLSTMTWRSLAEPSSGQVVGVFGDTMMIHTDGLPRLRRFAADGSFEDIELTGLPSGTTVVNSLKGDADGAVLQFNGSTYGVVDLRTGVVVPVPAVVAGSQSVLLSADRVAFDACPTGGDTCQVRIFQRVGLGADAVPQTITVPSTVLASRMLLAGSHLIAAANKSAATVLPQAVDYSLTGTPTVVPMTQTDMQAFAQAGDGGLVVGGTTGDWAVRRLTTGGDGAIVQHVVFALAGHQSNAGMTLSQGVLRHIEALHVDGDDSQHYVLFNHRLAGGTDGPAMSLSGVELQNPVPCQSDATCVRTVDSNTHGTAYLGLANNGFSYAFGQAATGTGFGFASHATAIVDASPNWVIANSSEGPAQWLLNVNGGTTTGPVRAAALWFDTLWTSPAAGTLSAQNQTTKVTSAPFTTGATCDADELQAALRYVYWSCGASGPSGVVDTVRKVNFALPGGRYLLGDGYVVRHDASTGQLLRYDLTGDVLGDPVALATMSSGGLTDDRNITWAVDKYSGDIGYVDADDAVHIVDPGVPASPPDTAGTSGSATVYFDLSIPGLTWALTRPIDSWTFTATRASNGEVTARTSGGAARVSLTSAWDGRLSSGAKAPSGDYHYSLTATANGSTATIATGTIGVSCGSPVFRSYTCDGLSTVLGALPDGTCEWLPLAPSVVGTLYNIDGFPGVTALIPFGDLNRDGYNDLIVRTTSGQLTVLYGQNWSAYAPHFGTAESKVVGTGWSGLKQVLTSGDLTGDGIPDILAQDTSGGLRRYNGTSTGTLANKVIIAGTWKQPALVGPGDFTGDGKSDLLGTSYTGDLYLYPGTGTGGFASGHKVGTGWSSYKIAGVGDANRDGHNDLVARDSDGMLWLYPGNGSGGFLSRKQLTSTVDEFTNVY